MAKNTTFPDNSSSIKTSAKAEIFVPKIMFFDIDDTLSRNGVIAPHNKTTLEQLSKTDIKLIIATGRSTPLLPDDILELLDTNVLDAIICINGQYAFNKHGVICDYPLTKEQASLITDICVPSQLDFKFDSTKHLAWAKHSDNQYLQKFIDTYDYCIVDPDYYKSNKVYQCSIFFNEDNNLQRVNFVKQGLKLVLWHHFGGDILPIEASKARGIKSMCQHYGVEPAECMAFGDGYNDLEMFDLVGYAVAMGDSEQQLIEAADFVTGTIEEFGLQRVIERLPL